MDLFFNGPLKKRIKSKLADRVYVAYGEWYDNVIGEHGEAAHYGGIELPRFVPGKLPTVDCLRCFFDAYADICANPGFHDGNRRTWEHCGLVAQDGGSYVEFVGWNPKVLKNPLWSNDGRPRPPEYCATYRSLVLECQTLVKRCAG